MPKYRVTKGRVYARAGDTVEMNEAAARKFGSRLEQVKPGPKPQKGKSGLHVQPADQPQEVEDDEQNNG